MSNISSEWNNLFNNHMNNIKHHNKIDFDIKLDDLYGLENKRIDYRHLKIYSIDPPKCSDADDAFSIFKDENNNIHLMIHIADPTAWFNPNDKLFDYIINNGCTIYLSNREPDHLFPNNILNNSSLTDGVKNVVIVHTILKPTYKPSKMFDIIKTNIEYGIIDCNNGKRFTYDEAAENIYNDITLYLGVDIAKFFYSQRQNNNHLNNFIFSELIFNIPKVMDNEVILKPDSKEVIIMKAMIGEFAIHANTIFANGLDDDNLFLRTLVLPNNINMQNNINNNIIHDLIKDGISANYKSDKLKHDLIGSYYTHSTSPLRRASDCIVHFLLKAKYLNIDSPFNENQLKEFAEKLNVINKEMKNIQFKDIKLRTFQWIAEELESRLNPIKMKIKVMGYKAPFVNLMIIGIDGMDVNIPYTIKRKKLNTEQEIFNINITKINYYNKYDEGTLPELDNLI
jgi:exoribonuclease R